MSRHEKPQLKLIQGGLAEAPFPPTSKFFTRPPQSSPFSLTDFKLPDDEFVLSIEILNGLRERFDLD